MPQWLARFLQVLSTPASEFAASIDPGGSKAVELVATAFTFTLVLALLAFAWFSFWRAMGHAVRQVARWAVRTGSLHATCQAERSSAAIEQFCTRVARWSGVWQGYRSDSPRVVAIPSAGAPLLFRLTQGLVRGLLRLLGEAPRIIVGFIRIMVSRFGLVICLLSILAVWPERTWAWLAQGLAAVAGVHWDRRLVVDTTAVVGVIVAVGVVVGRGMLPDRATAHRKARDLRSQEALAVITALSLPLATLTRQARDQLEHVCREMTTQLGHAEGWMAGRPPAAWSSAGEHLLCGADCPERYLLAAPLSTPSLGVLEAPLDDVGRAAEFGNPLLSWKWELGRLVRRRERSSIWWLSYREMSLREAIASDLRLLTEGEAQRLRIAWQHRCPLWLLASTADEPSERAERLEQLAAEYRDLVWDVLERLRQYEDVAEIAWRADGHRSGVLAKFFGQS